MLTKNIGYNRVEVRWLDDRRATGYRLYRSEGDGTRELVVKTKDSAYVDTVPGCLSRQRYTYTLEKRGGAHYRRVETAETNLADWCEDRVPMVHLPDRPGYEAIYRTAWELTWQGIVCSDALPTRYAYNDYPDNDVTYLWDTCFCTLFQRYAALQGVHPCMSTIDAFYAQMRDDGFIPRNFNWRTFEAQYGDGPSPNMGDKFAEGINPPLVAWAEWNYYLISGDKERLATVLPKLTRHDGFIDSYLEAEPGCYRWNAGGEGWDNLNWDQGDDEIYYYVDLLAQQALAARCTAQIADELGEDGIHSDFQARWEAKRGPLREIYWNEDKDWYCSLTRDRRFTRKTMNGLWPLVAGIADSEQAATAVRQTLMDPACFLTEPTPMPTVAKDEPGYNPLGEYWLGGVWHNISLMALRGLEEYGFEREALELTTRTLDATAACYQDYESFPHSLWECYAPERVAPASHKIVRPDLEGGVREEFRGWACCIINMLIENLLGFYVNAPRRELKWIIRLTEAHGIDRLRFGDVCTDLRIADREDAPAPAEITVRSDKAYTLSVQVSEREARLDVEPGESRFTV